MISLVSSFCCLYLLRAVNVRHGTCQQRCSSASQGVKYQYKVNKLINTGELLKIHVLVFGVFLFVLIACILFARGCWHQPRAVKAHRASTSPDPQIIGHQHGSQCQEKDPQAQRCGWVSSEQWCAEHHSPGEWAVPAHAFREHMDFIHWCIWFRAHGRFRYLMSLPVFELHLSASWNSPSCYKSVYYKWAKTDLWTLVTVLIIWIAGMKPAVTLWRKWESQENHTDEKLIFFSSSSYFLMLLTNLQMYLKAEPALQQETILLQRMKIM